MSTEKDLLCARLDDLLERSERGILCSTPFLNLKEQQIMNQELVKSGYKKRAVMYGGYSGAERKRLFVLPEYLSFLCDDDKDTFFDSFKEEITSVCSPVKIVGSGFVRLSHRDYLGAVLNLGVDRTSLGDICILEDYECLLFASEYVAKLLCDSCKRIANDKIKVEITNLPKDFSYQRNTKELTDTVASERLDCIVASLINESREKAKELILGSFVEVNFTECSRTDKRIENGDTLSIRGYGRFLIDSVDTETKKGRIRLLARKYI